MKNTQLSQRDEEIVEAAIEKIPTIEKILSEAIAKIPSEKLKTDYVKSNFSNIAVDIERIAYNVYLDYEKKTFPYLIEQWVNRNSELVSSLKKKLGDMDFVKEICLSFYPLARELEFRAGQMRKSRGGRTFERIIETLLRKIGVSCQRPTKVSRKTLKRIDLVVPDQHIALTRPDQAFFLSCKRTLRERWKQTIPERKPSWRVFLLTLDEELPEEKAVEIDQLGIIAYVKDDLKAMPHLASKDWVRRLSDLPRDLGIV